MKNFLTKLLAMTLAICALFTLTACGDTGAGGGGGDEPAHVHDYIDHVCSCGDVEQYTEGLRYKEITGGTISILGFEEGVEVPETVYIPQKINGKPVVAIGANAFKDATFKFIRLPDGLRYIYNYAFVGSNLNAITIPASVEQIHVQALNAPHLGTVNFVQTEGWYRGRHYMASPDPANAVKESTMADAQNMAKILTDTDRADNGGNLVWYRIVK